MIDPGALGTLLIGLDHHQHDDDRRVSRRTTTRHSRHRARDLAVQIAAALRRLADALDGARSPEALGAEA
jgi:hypothetical protein